MQRVPKKFGQRYPWKRWFEQRKFKLVQGEHYTQKSYVFAQMVRNAAHFGRDGVGPCKVRIKIAEDEKSIEVEVLPKERSNRAQTEEPAGLCA